METQQVCTPLLILINPSISLKKTLQILGCYVNLIKELQKGEKNFGGVYSSNVFKALKNSFSEANLFFLQ